MHRNLAACVVLVHLIHNALMPGKHVDQLYVRNATFARCHTEQSAFHKFAPEILLGRVEQAVKQQIFEAAPPPASEIKAVQLMNVSNTLTLKYQRKDS